MLLPFAIGGTAVLVDALRQTWTAERRRLFVPRAVSRRSKRIARPRRGAQPYSCTRDPSSMTQLLGSWK